MEACLLYLSPTKQASDAKKEKNNNPNCMVDKILFESVLIFETI